MTGLDAATGVDTVRRELDQVDEQVRCELLLAAGLHRGLAAGTGQCAEGTGRSVRRRRSVSGQGRKGCEGRAQEQPGGWAGGQWSPREWPCEVPAGLVKCLLAGA